MIKIGEDWPGLKIGTPKTFHENESKVTRVIHSAPEVEPKWLWALLTFVILESLTEILRVCAGFGAVLSFYQCNHFSGVVLATCSVILIT